jgi:hypothetical protein
MSNRYLCYDQNHEDLTALVEKARREQTTIAQMRIGNDPAPRGAEAGGWTVLVKCSKGHENVFSGD